MAKKILVADDEKPIVNLIRTNLEMRDYEVRIAYDGRETLMALSEFKPDLIILDVMMPHADGFEVLDILRNTPDTALIPVIMLTARTQEMDVAKGMVTGADAYLIKPFDISELLSFVERLLADEE